MPEAPLHPDPTLQATALRYAAGDLNAAEAVAFEARLADDQDARDALAEAVRLSAAALGQEPPTPHRSFRSAIRDRLAGWCPAWLARRAYRGHPLAWAALGAATVAACAVAGVLLGDPELAPEPDPASPPASVAVAPAPRPAAAPVAPEPRDGEALVAVAPASCDNGDAPSVAELWAQMSTSDGVEKAHEDEMKWRQKLRDAGAFSPSRGAARIDD